MRQWLGCLLLCLAACGGVELAPSQAGDEGDGGAYACSPMTCRGCCSGNVCFDGDEQLACGYEGRACRECGRGTRCVAPGTCASPSNDQMPGGPFDPNGVPIDPMTGMPMTHPIKRCIPTTEGHYCTGL